MITKRYGNLNGVQYLYPYVVFIERGTFMTFVEDIQI